MGPVIRTGSPRRQLVYEPLLIFYRVDERHQALRILRIRHAARKR